MAFNVTDVNRFDAVASVDARFSPITERLLWKDAVFVDGISFTSKHQARAGQIFVRRLGRVVTKVSSPLVSGGLDFTHTHTADELIPIVIDFVASASEKIYEAVEQARESATGAQIMEIVVLSVRDQFQIKAHTALLAEATSDANTTVTAPDKLKETILATRKTLRDIGAIPDLILSSTETYMKFLIQTGKEFIPSTNEELLRTAVVGKYFSINVIEDNQLIDDGTSGSTEYVFYDHEAFSIVFNIDVVRMVDAGKDFVGSYAQAQLIAGFKVTTPEAVIKKVVA